MYQWRRKRIESGKVGGGGWGWLQDLSEILTGKKKKKGFRSWLVSNIELKVGGPVPLAPASPRFRCV